MKTPYTARCDDITTYLYLNHHTHTQSRSKRSKRKEKKETEKSKQQQQPTIPQQVRVNASEQRKIRFILSRVYSICTTGKDITEQIYRLEKRHRKSNNRETVQIKSISITSTHSKRQLTALNHQEKERKRKNRLFFLVEHIIKSIT